ncbi:MAG: DUF748 domain-containing protein [Thermodesulfobacteriota bacterium]
MSKNDQDPFGSISISQEAEEPEPEKTEPEPAGLDVFIDQPADQPRTLKKRATRAAAAPDELRPAAAPQHRQRQSAVPGVAIILPAIVFLVFITYTLIGFLGVPYFFRNMLPAKAQKSINRAITFGAVSFNPFTLKLTLQNTIIGPNLADPDDQIDPLFSAGAIEADISWSSLFRRQFNCATLSADNLFLHLVRDKEQKYNLADLVPVREHQAIPVINLPFAYFLQNITVTNSRIVFDDMPAQKTHNLEQINLALPLLFHNPDNGTTARQTYPVSDRYINPRFSALINGSPVELTGKTKVDGENFQAQLQLHFNAVDLPAYLAYLPAQPGFSVDKGAGDILMDITFLSGPAEQLSLEIETTSRLSDITIKDRNGNISTVPEATVMATVYPLTPQYNFKEINLTNPALYLGRQADGQWSFPVLGPAPPTAAEGDKKTNLVVDKVKVTNGRLSFVDQKVAGGFTETLSELHCTLDNFSHLGNQAAPFSLQGTTSGKGKISLQGELVPAPLAIKGLATGNGLSLKKLSPYLAPAGCIITQGDIEKLTSGFAVHGGKKNQVSFDNAALDVSGFILSSQGRNWLTLPKAHLGLAMLQPGNALVKDVTLTADNGEIVLQWDSQNNFNWAQLKKNKGPAGSEKSWQVSLSSLELRQTMLHLEDGSLPTPISLSQANVHIKATDLATAADHQGDVLIETAELGGGTLTLSGPVALSPFAARFSCNLSNYRIATLPTLLTDWLNVTKIAGEVDAQGEISLPHFAYTGSLTMHHFSAGRESGPELVSFTTAETPRLDFTLKPLAVNIGELSLAQPLLRLIIPAKEPVNVSDLFSRTRPGLSDFANTGQIVVASIKLTDATLAFADQRVFPVYSSQLRLNGTMDNLINKPGEKLHINLTSTAEQQSTGSIAGDLGFFDTSLSADFEAAVQNMPLKEFSTYLGALLGYRLQDGRFAFTTRYQQENGNVTADNTLLVTALKLGEPQGTLSSQLPLTIALLADQNGEIKLHLPVKGSTSDPAYTLPGALGRSLRNTVLKTSVSPFSQLQPSFPELDQSRDHLLFAPGKADLTEENKKLLTLFAQVLAQRPLLTLSIKGYADQDHDAKILMADKKEIARQRELLELRRSAQITEKYGKEEISPANQQPAPPPPPRPAPDFSVGKNELLQLAKQRQKAVNDFLVSALKSDQKRVIQDSSGALVPADAAGRPGNRVDLKIGAVITR